MCSSDLKCIILAIDAPIDLRFQRSLRRGRPGDGKTIEEFLIKEEEELTNDSGKQQLAKCIEMADFAVDNSGDKEELRRQIISFLEKAPAFKSIQQS